jgi:uroporphyrinogen-III decarboxylase
MNSYERVKNRLKGNPVDKIPNLNIIMTFAAKYIGVPYKKYVTDFKVLVEGNISCCEKFGIDMVSAISDPCRELFDFGANVVLPENDVPYCKDFLIKEYADIKKVKVK